MKLTKEEITEAAVSQFGVMAVSSTDEQEQDAIYAFAAWILEQNGKPDLTDQQKIAVSFACKLADQHQYHSTADNLRSIIK